MTGRKRPPTLDDYLKARPLLRHVRVMERVMRWVDDDPKMRPFLPAMHCAYMDILNEELAPHALTLALSIAQLEDAFPEIAALVETEDTGE
jgi:hypothetical protein